MKKQVLVCLIACFAVIQYAIGQKVKGNPKTLKEVQTYKVIFDYSDIKIGKFKTEEDFLKDKMDKREAKEKGAGEKFKKSWFDDRETRFKPKFIESFNKRFDDGELSVTEEDADYVIKVHTTWTYPGYNVGIVRHDAEVTATVSIYKASEPSTLR